jgi:hypothetical protein
MSFWNSGSGAQITGTPEHSFVFEKEEAPTVIVPNNTTALAKIINFAIKETSYNGKTERFYQITWNLESGEFKDCFVKQKIKCFDNSLTVVDRALNMLKLVMDLCNFKPEHSGEPTNSDLLKMKNKILGIKIREHVYTKSDGSLGCSNWVSEVHPAANFVTETGIKIEHKPIDIPYQSALSRNNKTSNPIDVDDDLPF